jgi:hypothetical protein
MPHLLLPMAVPQNAIETGLSAAAAPLLLLPGGGWLLLVLLVLETLEHQLSDN